MNFEVHTFSCVSNVRFNILKFFFFDSFRCIFSTEIIISNVRKKMCCWYPRHILNTFFFCKSIIHEHEQPLFFFVFFFLHHPSTPHAEYISNLKSIMMRSVIILLNPRHKAKCYMEIFIFVILFVRKKIVNARKICNVERKRRGREEEEKNTTRTTYNKEEVIC